MLNFDQRFCDELERKFIAARLSGRKRTMFKHLSVVAVTIMALLAPLTAGAGGQKTWARFNKTYNESLMVRENGEIFVVGSDMVRYSPTGSVLGRTTIPGDDRRISWKEFFVYPNGEVLAIYAIGSHLPEEQIFRIMRLDLSGKPLWERIIETPVHSFAVFPDDCVVLAVSFSGNKGLIKLDGSGNMVRQVSYPGHTPHYLTINEGKIVFVTDTGLVQFNADLELIEEKEVWKGFRPSDLVVAPGGYAVAGRIRREAKELLPWEAGLGLHRDPRQDSDPIIARLSDHGDLITVRTITSPARIVIDPLVMVSDQDGLLLLGTWSYRLTLERNYSLFTSRLDWDLKTKSLNYYFPVLSPGHRLESLQATPDGGVAVLLTDFKSIGTTVKLDSYGRCLAPSCAVFQVSTPSGLWWWIQDNILAPIFNPGTGGNRGR